MLKSKRRKRKTKPTPELTPEQYQAKIGRAEELLREADLQKEVDLQQEVDLQKEADLQKADNLQKALALLEEALQGAPRDFKSCDKSALWHKIADLYVQLGDTHRATIYYRRFLKWHPDSPNYRDVLLKLIDLYWLEDNKFTQIVNLLEQLRERDANDWSSRLQLQEILPPGPILPPLLL